MVLYTALSVMTCTLWHDMGVAQQICISMPVSARIPNVFSQQSHDMHAVL